MKGFIFDINKCVACHACVVACAVENDLLPPYFWRSVDTYNTAGHPKLEVFNLSLACNHCEDAECMPACPADAYYRDKESGAVLVDPDICMGCTYCSWACPFDAPKFNSGLRIIDKCTLCYSRLKIGDLPACTLNCPTGALSFGEMDDEDQKTSAKGFPENSLKPAIRFIESRPAGKPDTHLPAPPADLRQAYLPVTPHKKLSLKSEWALLLFTLMVPLLTAGLSGVLAGYLYIKPSLYVLISSVSLLLSTMHLGKPLRSVYAIRNLKTSWLSREILTYGLLYFSSALYLFFMPENQVAGVTAVVFGLACLFNIDRVYRYFQDGSGMMIHSSWVFLTGLLWIALILQEPLPLFFIILLKLILYSYRKKKLWTGLNLKARLISVIRILTLIVPLIMYFMAVDIIYFFYVLIIGELIDRIEFYTESYIQSPARQVFSEFRNDLEQSA